MGKIKVLLADDHNILRQGLIDVLRNYEDIVVVAEAESGSELKIKFDKHHPDIVLTDIEMPEGSGIEAATEILKSNPRAKILFLSMFFNEDYILKGVGWLLKTYTRYQPEVIIEYLNKNKKRLPRLILRYASEKLSKETRTELLKK